MNLGSCQMRSARSDIAASSTTPLASTLPSPPRPRPRAPTPAWPRWPRRTRLWRRWRRCFGRLVVDSAATSSVHIRSPCCTTVSCLFRNFRQHFLKRGYFAILDFQPYYNIACILYTVELYTLHNYWGTWYTNWSLAASTPYLTFRFMSVYTCLPSLPTLG